MKTSDKMIGIRAAEEIGRRDQPLTVSLRQLGVSNSAFYEWDSGGRCPSAPALQAMAFWGYDVNYILTGKRKETK